MAYTGRLLLLFGALTGLFVLVGWVLGTYWAGGWVAMSLLFAVLALAMNLFAYFFSDKMVLWSYRARIVTENEAPRLVRIVRRVATLANLPMPKVAIVPTKTPNAFATGRNPKHAVVAATEGILDLLNDEELEGVLAHEIGHVTNRDILVMTVAATLAGAIAFLFRAVFWSSLYGGRRNNGSNTLVLLAVGILAGVAAALIRLAISRSREYKADYTGAKLIMKPRALAAALRKLEEGNRRRPLDRGNPATASMFIVNPFRGSGFFTLFMTHPPLQKRIERLEKMARESGSL